MQVNVKKQKQFLMQPLILNYFPQDTFKRRCGCYVINPQAIGINVPRALVPLKNIDYSIEIVNSLVSITLTQKYFNPIDKFLSVNYSLPISPNSSIYKFVAQFSNTEIEGIVKEKEEAKNEFEKAKSEGKQAVIGTVDPDSKDILNFEIGNIPPQSQFTVTVSMLQEMKISLNTFYELHVPSTISPRYMNRVNGENKVSEHQVAKGESSGKADFTWTFKVQIKTTRKVIFYDSPTHKLSLLSQSEKGTETLLIMEKSEIPNKDFTFFFTTEDFQLPGYVLGSTDTSSTVMLSFIPKFCDLNVNDAYKASVANKPYETDMSSARGDYVFLLDRSGSMGGSRIKKAKQALIIFLKSLPEDSYFNVISFGSSSSRMFPESKRYTSKQVQNATKTVEKMDADMGGTEIYDPLSKLLNQKVIEGYPRQVFLLTDGDVSDTQGVIQMVRKNTKFSRVHAIGVGNGVSLDLVNGCAEAGKGKSVVISDNENPSDKIIELLEATLTPLISKINLKYENKNQIQSIVPNPESIPYILKDEIANFYITYKGPLTDKQVFEFEYQDSVTKLPYKSTLEVDPSCTLNQPFVDKMAHFKVIRSLQNSAKDGVSIEDQMYYVKVKDFKKEAIDYSVKHQVLSEFTAFICIGKELVDGQYQQFKNKGTHEIHVEQPKPVEQQRKSSYSSFAGGALYGAPPPAAMKLCKAVAKKKASPGILSSISKSVMGLFKSEQKQQQKAQKMVPQQFCDHMDNGLRMQAECDIMEDECDSQEAQQDNFSPQIESKEKASKKSQKQPSFDSKPRNVSKDNDVSSIIKLQLANGSWNEAILIDKLGKDSGNLKILAKEIGQQLVVTQLVVVWLQKYYPEKQYALIIKKALSWIKKTIGENQVWRQKLKHVESI